MSDTRAASTASNLPKSASVPAYLAGFLTDPSTDAEVPEYVFLLADLQNYFGSPQFGTSTSDPADGVTLPSAIIATASDTKAFRLLNTTTGMAWDYNPGSGVWHGKKRVSQVIPGDDITSYAFTAIPAGFTYDQVESVELEQVAGSEVLSIARWDILTSGTVNVKFVGRQVSAGNHRLHLVFRK